MRHLDRWNGYSLELPEGWAATWQDGAVLAGPTVEDGSGVFVRAVALPAAITLEELASRAVRQLAAGDGTFEAWAGPKGERDGTRQQLLFFRRRGLRGSLRLALRDAFAWVSGFQAPEAQVLARRPALERVLASFRVEAPLPREPFVEPGERAFSFLYPRGWRAAGRVQRDPRGGISPAWEVEDPRTHARVSSPGTVIPFTAPSPLGAWFGGGPFSAPFTPAAQLCQGVLLQLARQQRPDLVLEKAEPDANLGELQRRGLAGVEQRLGCRAEATGAAAWTAYSEGGVRFRELTIVTTWRLTPESWFASLGPAMRAPAEVFVEWLPVLKGISQSFQMNEVWDQGQMDAVQRRMAEERAAAERYRAARTRETLDYVHRIDREIQAGHSATLSELNRVGSNTVLGKEDVLGAEGRSYKVDTGYESYWEKEGKVLGSSSSELDGHLGADGWQKMTVF